MHVDSHYLANFPTHQSHCLPPLKPARMMLNNYVMRGGSGLATYLLSKALPAVSAENNTIHEWTYRDIQTLPSD